MRISKKFLITILSLTLLFSISCNNEDKTGGGNEIPSGDIDKLIDKLLNSVPSPTGYQVDNPINNNALLSSNITLTLDLNESDLLGNYPMFSSKEEFFELSETYTNYTFIMTNNLIIFNQIKQESDGTRITNTMFSNAQLLFNTNGQKYSAGYSTNFSKEGSHISLKEYIEFERGWTYTYIITNFKYVFARSSNDGAIKGVYKQ